MQDTPIVVRRVLCGTPWKPHNMVAGTTQIVLALNRVTRWMVKKCCPRHSSACGWWRRSHIVCPRPTTFLSLQAMSQWIPRRPSGWMQMMVSDPSGHFLLFLPLSVDDKFSVFC